MTRPYCENEEHGAMRKNGKTKAGSQRYRCSKCGHTLTIDKGKAGAPLAKHNDKGRAFTSTERVRRHREKKKAERGKERRIYLRSNRVQAPGIVSHPTQQRTPTGAHPVGFFFWLCVGDRYPKARHSLSTNFSYIFNCLSSCLASRSISISPSGAQ